MTTGEANLQTAVTRPAITITELIKVSILFGSITINAGVHDRLEDFLGKGTRGHGSNQGVHFDIWIGGLVS